MGGAKVSPVGSVLPASGQPDADTRRLLRQIPPAIERLLGEFDAAGVDRKLRGASSSQLHALDRGLPRQSLDDLLAACEAYALVTAPSALAQGDEVKVRAEAERMAASLEILLRAATRRRSLTRLTTASTSMQAPLLRAALEERSVRDALQYLVEIFGLLAAEGDARRRVRPSSRLLPLGGRLLMPGSVLATALALIVLLLGSIAFAAGGVTVSPRGIGLRGLPVGAQPTATNVSPTNTESVATATATPPARDTVTPSPGGGTTPTPAAVSSLAVSNLNRDPCPSATFTITYSSGQGAVTWTAKVDNSANILLSSGGSGSPQVSGTLTQEGQQATVSVQSVGTGQGVITVSASNGQTYQVNYDTTGC